MPKTIELTVEIVVQRVSCPGVWLCQDGAVSLIVFALGTSYETCMLPPTFPLQFNDKLYFRKRFQETCALSNMCSLLKDETLYCELVQWSQNCESGECNILAQYLGSLSDILFPPKMCCSDGVDLLMRRSKKYPGILSPKIEITTKVRIDEVWNENQQNLNANFLNMKNITNCNCIPRSGPRQKPVCHSPEYHRNKCLTGRPGSKCRSRSRSRSGGSSASSGASRAPDKFRYQYPDPASKRRTLAQCERRRDFCVFNANLDQYSWSRAAANEYHEDIERDKQQEVLSKVLLESRYVDDEARHTPEYEDTPTISHTKMYENSKPCLCEICKRYHELFHQDSDARVD